jgi:hypothetical protein
MSASFVLNLVQADIGMVNFVGFSLIVKIFLTEGNY